MCDGAIYSFLGGGKSFLGDGVLRLVLKQFVGVDAKELPAWERPRALEPFAQCSGERVAFHFPELGHLDLCRVHCESGSHRREQLDAHFACRQYEQSLVL